MVDMDKMSWLEVEAHETLALLRDKLEKMNKEDGEDLCAEDCECLKNIWKTIYYLKSVLAMTK